VSSYLPGQPTSDELEVLIKKVVAPAGTAIQR